jgi:hypothetical protein
LELIGLGLSIQLISLMSKAVAVSSGSLLQLFTDSFKKEKIRHEEQKF